VSTYVSEEYITSIFRVEKYAEEETSVKARGKNMEAMCSSETSVENGLHGVISQKMVLFINIAVWVTVPKHFPPPPPPSVSRLSPLTLASGQNLTTTIVTRSNTKLLKPFFRYTEFFRCHKHTSMLLILDRP
jgi:hypothetical protein